MAATLTNKIHMTSIVNIKLVIVDTTAAPALYIVGQ